MDDFDDAVSEQESYVSEGEKGSGSELDEDSGYRELQPEISGRNIEQQIIDQRLRAVLDFNAGLIQPVEYFTILKNTQQKLDEIEYNEDEIDEKLIEKEAELNSILATFIERIKQIPDLQKYVDSNRNVIFDAPGLNNFLSPEEIQQLNKLKSEIEEIKETYVVLHPGLDEPEPLPSTLFEAVWQSMDIAEQDQIKNLAKAAKLIYPEQQNYSSTQLFAEAQFNFYDQIKMFLPGYFDYFEKKEKAEIENLAKKLKIHKPLLNEYSTKTEYDIALTKFYTDVFKLLPGYITKMNIRSIGSSYQLVNEKSIINSIKEDASKTLAIQLSEEDERSIKSQKVLKTILRELESSSLIDCIMSSGAVNLTDKVYQRQLKTKRIDQYPTKDNLKPKDRTVPQPSNVKEKLPTFANLEERKEYFRKRRLDESQNLEVLQQKDKVMAELTGSHKWKKYKNTNLSVEFQTRGTELITSKIRKISKDRLNYLFNTCKPEFKPNVSDLVNLIEDYIFRLTNIVQYPYRAYTEKIDELIFVLKNYKFFINDLLSGKINPYQFALFQKEIYSESKLHVFTAKISIRRFMVNQIYRELLNIAERNNIIFQGILLTKFLINFKSKRLELLIYDLSSTKIPDKLQRWERENVFQKNERYYLEMSRKLLKLIKNSEISIGIITNGINNDQILQSLVNNVSTNTNPDYSLFNIKDIEILMSQELETIKDLEREKKKLDAINYSGIYITLWKPEIDIFTPAEISEWNKLIQDLKTSLNFKSVNYSKYLFKLNSLDKFKKKLLETHNLTPDNRLNEISKLITNAESKLNNLKMIRVDKINSTNEIYRQRYVKFLQRKFGELPLPPTTVQKYHKLSPDLIFQVIQAFKRNLITHTVLYKIKGPIVQMSVTPGLKPLTPQVQIYQNKLIELLQLIDLNELNNQEEYIVKEAYVKIKNKLIIEIDQIIRLKYEFVNERFLNEAIDKILDFFKIKFTGNFENKFQTLVASWPKDYIRQRTIVDFYGEDLFYKLFTSVDVLSFYDSKEVRVYNSMVNKNTPAKQEIYKKPRALFNAKTGKFGNEANDGELYDVFKLDRDPGTRKPIEITKEIMEKDSRTGLYVPVTKVVQKQGKFSFILRELRTNKQNVTEKEWIEVPLYAVKMYPLGYDSCSRFNKNELACKSAKGLKNSQCEYNDSICYAKK